MKSFLLVLVVWLSESALIAGDETIKTNLTATITITVSTNVVNGDNTSGCWKCSNGSKYTLELPSQPHWNCEPYKSATERWTITNVVRRVTLTTDWNGKQLNYSEETVLSSVTNRWKLTQEWKQNQ